MQTENFNLPPARGSPPIEMPSDREKLLQLLAKLLARKWWRDQQREHGTSLKPKA